MNTIQYSLGLGLILSTALVQAKDFQGNFVGQNGFAQIEIYKNKLHASAISGSGNLCDLEGTYTSGIVRAANQCSFKLKPTPNGGFTIDLPYNSSCNYFCGLNVSISGTYLPIPTICENKRFDQALAMYRKQYHAQQYQTAYQTFSKTLSTCKPYIDFLMYDKAASELSLSLKKLGRTQECQKLLSQTSAYGKTEAEVKEDYRPVMYDSYIDTAKTIWFNAKACETAQ